MGMDGTLTWEQAIYLALLVLAAVPIAWILLSLLRIKNESLNRPGRGKPARCATPRQPSTPSNSGRGNLSREDQP